MKDIYVYLWLSLLAGLTLVAAAAWWFISRRHRQWCAWVDRENDLWVRKGMMSPSLAERIKKHEKGPIPKMLAIAATSLGVAGLFWISMNLVEMIRLEHQDLRLPFNPALMPKPIKPSSLKPSVRPPATNSPAKIRKQS